MSDAQWGIAPPGTYAVVLGRVRPLERARVLDIPCGQGGFARQMASEGAVCIAADRRAVPGNRPMVVADMNAGLPFRDGAFDVVTCLEGIEHSQNPFQLVREFSRVLRPGGRLALSTPNIHNLRSRIKFLLRGTLFWFDPREVTGIGHVTVIPYFILKHLLAEAGFSEVAVRINGVVRPSVPAWLAGVMQRVFSKRTGTDQELNSTVLLNGEGLVWFASKAGRRDT
jgi:ubiquinone/menaquinone biosynthesis C-methylase UbiE